MHHRSVIGRTAARRGSRYRFKILLHHLGEPAQHSDVISVTGVKVRVADHLGEWVQAKGACEVHHEYPRAASKGRAGTTYDPPRGASVAGGVEESRLVSVGAFVSAARVRKRRIGLQGRRVPNPRPSDAPPTI